jgi:hypothetical protein
MCSINHEKKAIFIHIPKTAGTFIYNNLEKYYGFTYYQIKRPDHNIFCDINNNTIIKNIKNYHSGNKIYGILEYFKNTPHNNKYGIFQYSNNSDYINNITGMTEEKWNSYYKFCFIRNPYDRLISGYNYCIKYLDININFDKYIYLEDNISPYEYIHIFMNQEKHIKNIDNKIIIDYIGNFENIEEDFEKILLKIGFNKNDIIHSKEKKNNNSHEKPSYYIYNQELLNKVNDIINNDLLTFSYEKIENIEIFKNKY